MSADPTSLSLKSFKSSQYFYLDFLLQQTDNYPCKQEQLIWELSPLGKANFTAEYSHFPTEDIQLKTNIFCISFGENLTSLLVLLWQLQLQEEPVAVPKNLSHYPINIHHLRYDKIVSFYTYLYLSTIQYTCTDQSNHRTLHHNNTTNTFYRISLQSTILQYTRINFH